MRLKHGCHNVASLAKAEQKWYIVLMKTFTKGAGTMPRQLLQLKGDPSIRQFVFSQSRTESMFDQRYDELIKRIEELFLFYGAFHVQIHMSTCQVTVWLLDDPYNYRVLAGDEIFNPPLERRSRAARYPVEASISAVNCATSWRNSRRCALATKRSICALARSMS